MLHLRSLLYIKLIVLFIVLNNYQLIFAQEYNLDTVKFISWEEIYSKDCYHYKIIIGNDGSNKVIISTSGNLTKKLLRLKESGWKMVIKKNSDDPYNTISLTYGFYFTRDEAKKLFRDLIYAGISKLPPVDFIICDGNEVELKIITTNSLIQKKIDFPAYNTNSDGDRILNTCLRLFNTNRLKHLLYGLE